MDVVLTEDFIVTQLGSSWDDWYEFFVCSRLRVVRPQSLSDIAVQAMGSDGRVNFVSKPSNPNSYVECGRADDFTSFFEVSYSDRVFTWNCKVSIPCDADVEGLEHYFASNIQVGGEVEYRPSFDFRVQVPSSWDIAPCADAATHGGLFVSRGWFSFREVFDDLFVSKGVDFDLLLTPSLEGVSERDSSPSELATVRCQANILKELDVLLETGWRIASGCRHTLLVVGRAGSRDVIVDQDLIGKLANSLSIYLNRKYNSKWTVIVGCVPYGIDLGHNTEKRRLYVMGGPSVFDLTNELSVIWKDKIMNRGVDVRVTSAFSVDWEGWVDTCLNLDNPGIKLGVSH